MVGPSVVAFVAGRGRAEWWCVGVGVLVRISWGGGGCGCVGMAGVVRWGWIRWSSELVEDINVQGEPSSSVT